MTTVQPPPPPPPPAPPQPAPDGDTVPADIVKLPESLTATDRAITLKGEVVTVNADGTVRLSTPRGPVEVQLPPDQIPARGQTVEVKIPAGSPPQDAQVTLPRQTGTPPAQQTVPQTPAPQDVIGRASSSTSQAQQAPQPTASPTQARPDDVSPQKLLAFLKASLDSVLKPQTQTPIANLAPQPLVQRPLAEGQLARLIPLASLPGQSVQPLTPAPAAQGAPLLPAPSLNATLQIQTPATPTGNTIIAILQTATTSTPPQTTLLTIPQGQPATTIVPEPTAWTLVTPDAAPAKAALVTLPALQTPAALSTANTTQGAVTIANPVTPHAPVMQNIPSPPSADVRITGAMPPVPLQPGPIAANLIHGAPTAPPVLLAGVLGQTPQGLPVLEVELPGTAPTAMVLQYPAANLTPATVLKLEILPQATHLIAPALGATTAQTAAAQSLPWQALDDAFTLLRTDPQNQPLTQALQTALPRPGATTFAAPVLMLASAIQQGDVLQLLGKKTADLLRETKKGSDILTRLGGDIASARDRTDTPKGEWRALTLPFVHGQELHRIVLHTRRFDRDEREGNQSRKTGTRFVMDVALSRMGPLQIDGFSVEKRLDITLRSEKPLSPPMREVMRSHYATALEGIGFAGQLNFNASPERAGWQNFDKTKKQSAQTRV